MIKAPGHRKRTHRKGHRKGTDKPTGRATVVETGVAFSINAITSVDGTISDGTVDQLNRRDGITFETETEFGIESSENLTTCEIRQSCPGRVAKSALVRIAKHHTGKLIVRHEFPDPKTGHRPTHTIDQILHLPGSTIGQLLKKGSLTIDLPEDAIPLHRLDGMVGKRKVIEYRDTQTRLESKSSGHDVPIGPTPGQDGRGRRPGCLPTGEEIDRKENGDSETSQYHIPTGGIRELEKAIARQDDNHQQHIDNLPA